MVDLIQERWYGLHAYTHSHADIHKVLSTSFNASCDYTSLIYDLFSDFLPTTLNFCCHDNPEIAFSNLSNYTLLPNLKSNPLNCTVFFLLLFNVFTQNLNLLCRAYVRDVIVRRPKENQDISFSVFLILPRSLSLANFCLCQWRESCGAFEAGCAACLCVCVCEAGISPHCSTSQNLDPGLWKYTYPYVPSLTYNIVVRANGIRKKSKSDRFTNFKQHTCQNKTRKRKSTLLFIEQSSFSRYFIHVLENIL